MMSARKMRIVVTGSRGDVGRFVVPYARQQPGVDVLSVDMTGRGEWGSYISADMTDLGQVYDVLHGADAVINLAAISDPYVFPAARTFTTNIGITWNVFEAAARLGIKRVVNASSIQVNHPAFPHEPIKYSYLPFDEDHPTDPHDEYGMSKKVGEALADSFAHHWGMTVISLRITWSVDPQLMHKFPLHVPEQLPEARPGGHRWLPSPFYIDARDCARACYLAATVDLPAATHIPLILSAPDSCLDMPSEEIARRFFPEARILPSLRGFASIANGARAERVLGFVPEFGWREPGKEKADA
jgi:UDP-glucose 4-epimerase